MDDGYESTVLRGSLNFYKILKNLLKTCTAELKSIATTLNNLAGLYQQVGDYNKTLPLYQMALEISKQELGLKHSTWSDTSKKPAPFPNEVIEKIG